MTAVSAGQFERRIQVVENSKKVFVLTFIAALMMIMPSLTPLAAAQGQGNGSSNGSGNGSANGPARTALIVKTARGLSQAQRNALVEKSGGALKRSIDKLDLHVIEVPAQAAAAITENLKKEAGQSK